MRLFVCLQCKSVETLPDYRGPMEWSEEYRREVPAYDPQLEYIIEPHRRKQHVGHLIHVEDRHWEDSTVREEILKQIRDNTGETGLGSEAYAVRNTLNEDALKCFSQHGRPQDGCIDWHDRSKRLGNPLMTADEKKAAKRVGLRRAEEVYLCDHCPVASNYVQKKKFEKDGLYG